MKKTIKQVLDKEIVKIKENNIPTPELDAEILLAHVLKKTREHVLSHPKQELSELQIKNYKSKIARRCLAEPIAYITGHKEFYGLDFLVTKDTLIPRPETELMVDEGLALLRNKIIVVDVGTGCGNIAISLAKNIQDATFAENVKLFAIDTSLKTLEIAKQNAEDQEVSENITFLGGRFLNPLIENHEIPIETWSAADKNNESVRILILANLPYLSKDIYNSSPTSVKNFEPKEALLSSHDGLAHYRKLLNQIKLLIAEYRIPVTALFEISPEQKPLIIREIKSHLPNAKIDLKKDLAGKWRLAIISSKITRL